MNNISKTSKKGQNTVKNSMSQKQQDDKIMSARQTANKIELDFSQNSSLYQGMSYENFKSGENSPAQNNPDYEIDLADDNDDGGEEQ